MSTEYDYTIDDLTNARADGWDDCKRLILELLRKNIVEHDFVIDGLLCRDEFVNINVIEEIENENFGVIDIMPITKIEASNSK